MPSTARRRAAFLDRDGVLNVERGYVHRSEDFAWLPGSVKALAALQECGYALIVVTNQSGIARGLYSEEDYQCLTAHMRAQLRDAGVQLDAVEYCPHLPDAAVERFRLRCDCRKPEPGMLLRAMRALDVDPHESIMVGDRSADILAARAAGVSKAYLVRSGQLLSDQDLALADAVYDDLAACVRAICG